MTTVLNLRDLTRIHHDGGGDVIALADVDLSVEPGELVAVTGRSGCGKSTLLNLAGGLDQPTRGSVTVVGQELGAMRGRELARLRRRHVGYVFQDLNLLPTLTGLENVMLPLELEGASTADARRQAGHALEAVSGAHRARISRRMPSAVTSSRAPVGCITERSDPDTALATVPR